jgi:hypothetical protein
LDHIFCSLPEPHPFPSHHSGLLQHGKMMTAEVMGICWSYTQTFHTWIIRVLLYMWNALLNSPINPQWCKSSILKIN